MPFMQDAEARAVRELQARQELTEQLEQLVPELTAAVALLKQLSALVRMWALLSVILTSAGKASRTHAHADAPATTPARLPGNARLESMLSMQPTH